MNQRSRIQWFANLPLVSRFINAPWGSWGLVSLYISLFSGVIVGIQYNGSTPFYSTASLDLLVPYGAYFRSLHFYSSQFFFLFIVIHYIVIFNKTEQYSAYRRILLVLSMPTILILLFTGYVLRSDSTGSSAGIIAENILLAVPLIGTVLNETLFSIAEHGMQRVYLHHVISFDLLLLLLAWDHLRRYPVRLSHHLLFITFVLIFSIFIAAPMDPEELGTFYITGPWFFLGLQELLRYLHPFIAGIIVPATLILALVMLDKSHPWFRRILIFIMSWLLLYLLLSLLALTTHG